MKEGAQVSLGTIREKKMAVRIVDASHLLKRCKYQPFAYSDWEFVHPTRWSLVFA
jgi:hypothetical protein